MGEPHPSKVDHFFVAVLDQIFGVAIISICRSSSSMFAFVMTSRCMQAGFSAMAGVNGYIETAEAAAERLQRPAPLERK